MKTLKTGETKVEVKDRTEHKVVFSSIKGFFWMSETLNPVMVIPPIIGINQGWVVHTPLKGHYDNVWSFIGENAEKEAFAKAVALARE